MNLFQKFPRNTLVGVFKLTHFLKVCMCPTCMCECLPGATENVFLGIVVHPSILLYILFTILLDM